VTRNPGLLPSVVLTPADQATQALEERVSGAITVPIVSTFMGPTTTACPGLSDGMDAVFKNGFERSSYPVQDTSSTLSSPRRSPPTFWTS